MPKSLEAMVIVRFCLKQLFNYFFKNAEFENIIFNPEMINLLFDDDKTILKQFHVQTLLLSARDNTIKIFLNGLNHFVIYLCFSCFYTGDFSERQNADVLFNILINRGNKLPKVVFAIFSFPWIYNRFIEGKVICIQNKFKL